MAVFLVVPTIVLIGGSMITVLIDDMRYWMRGHTLAETVQWVIKNESLGGLWNGALDKHSALMVLVLILAPFSAIIMSLPGGWRHPYRNMILVTLPLLGVTAAIWFLPGAAGVWGSALLFGSIVGSMAMWIGAYTVRRLYVWLER